MKKNNFVLLAIAIHFCLISLAYAYNSPTCADRIVGNWQLVANYERSKSGTTYPYGQSPKGYLAYDHEGNMSVQMMRRSRNNNNSLLNDYFAYFGHYSINCQTHVISHYLTGSLDVKNVGTVRKRRFLFSNNKLYLYPIENKKRVIIWQR